MFRAGNTGFSSSFRPKGPRGSACILAAPGRAAPRFGRTAPDPLIVDGNVHHPDNAVNIEINDGGVTTPHLVSGCQIYVSHGGGGGGVAVGEPGCVAGIRDARREPSYREGGGSENYQS